MVQQLVIVVGAYIWNLSARTYAFLSIAIGSNYCSLVVTGTNLPL